MAEKKGFWATLFGGGCSCGMNIEEEDNSAKKHGKKGGCCDMQIVEEPKKKRGGCCDMQIVEETDDHNAT